MKLYPNITKIYIIWLLAVLLSFYLGFLNLPHSGKFEYDFWGSLGNWDGGHFLGIAADGYSEKFQYAFFPLFPLAIRTLNYLTQNYLFAGILISVVSTFLGTHLLYKLVSLDFKKQIAEKVVLVFLFFPTSFYFLTVYSEGLFFLLTISAFYFLRQNRLFWATIFAALASATRLVGLAVVAGILVDVLTKQGLTKKNWYILLSFSGFLIYCLFLYKQTGDLFYFMVAENHWQRVLINPWVGFWETLKNVPNGVLDLAFTIFGLGFAIRAFRFLPPSLSIYSLLSVGIPLFTPTLSSMPRFLLPVFPIFILIALIKKPDFMLIYRVISLMMLAIFSALFIAGYWVS